MICDRCIVRTAFIRKISSWLPHPIPTSGKITVEGSEDEIGEIRIVTLLGQDVTSDVIINRFSTYVEIDLSVPWKMNW